MLIDHKLLHSTSEQIALIVPNSELRRKEGIAPWWAVLELLYSYPVFLQPIWWSCICRFYLRLHNLKMGCGILWGYRGSKTLATPIAARLHMPCSSANTPKCHVYLIITWDGHYVKQNLRISWSIGLIIITYRWSICMGSELHLSCACRCPGVTRVWDINRHNVIHTVSPGLVDFEVPFCYSYSNDIWNVRYDLLIFWGMLKVIWIQILTYRHISMA